MRFLIVGAGAIGGYFGGRLLEAAVLMANTARSRVYGASAAGAKKSWQALRIWQRGLDSIVTCTGAAPCTV